MKEISIPLSRKKITLLFLGAIVLVTLSVWVIGFAESQTRFNPLFIKTVSVLGIVFFGFSGIYVFTRFFNTKPGLVINDEGIRDSSSFASAGLIKWKNITNIRAVEIYGQKILTLEVDNADEIIAKHSGLKKFLMSSNKKSFGSPVQISSNALKCNFQELHDMIKDQLSFRHIT